MMKKKLIILLSLINILILSIHNASASSGYDKNLPIEITADSLEVLQNEKIAIFSGSVDAKQGEILLKAEKLKVNYTSSNLGGKQSVSKIFAEGNVSFSSKLESANSDKGEYDVEQGLITLSGDVKLTQGNNILRGSKLIIDLKTGKNTMIGSQKSLNTTTKDGRVKGLFTPKKTN